jgi:hypothetical protein
VRLCWRFNQHWRTDAAHAEWERAGDGKHPTARFRPVTRGELLRRYPPDPSLDEVLKSASEVLKGAHPGRAIAYWNAAIKLLKKSKKVGYVDGYAGPGTALAWTPEAIAERKQRKTWQKAWCDEPLDIRPPRESLVPLHAIATTAAREKRLGRPRKQQAQG